MNDSVSWLKEVFQEKTRANSRYSLRAFAKHLGVSAGGLSQILSRKKRLSIDRAHEFIQRLNLNREQSEVFLTLVEIEQSSSEARKADLYEKLSSFQQKNQVFNLTLDQFRLINDWFGFAVWELITDCGAHLSDREIARRLGITTADVEVTIERLLRLELIEPLSGPKRYQRTNDNLLFEAGFSAEALRNYYASIGELAQRAVVAQTSAERVSGAQIFSFDPSQIEEVRKLTDKYLMTLNKLAMSGKKRTEVYQALAHVFRVTELDKSKAKKDSPVKNNLLKNRSSS
jgi:uncharacterized protein (TIGR02147 family)